MARWDDVWFWVARHGRTEANEEDIYRSWSNYWKTQLSDEGRKEANEAATYLQAIKAPIEIIIADSLDRTIETAEIIGNRLGVQKFEFLKGLHPLNMGDLTLKSKSENPVEPYMADTDKRIPGGETRKEFDTRQKETFEAIQQLVSVVPGGNILVVGHGSNVCYLHNEMFGHSGSGQASYEGLVDPGGVLQVTQDGIKPLTKKRQKSEKKEKVDVPVERLTEGEAEYMELSGAVKDADCEKVAVKDGVSRSLGCCDKFQPNDKKVSEFRCGTCEYVKKL